MNEVEQIIIHNGYVSIKQRHPLMKDIRNGQAFLDRDGNEVIFEMTLVDMPHPETDFTKGQQWIYENIKPEKVEKELRSELFGNDYDPKDYFL